MLPYLSVLLYLQQLCTAADRSPVAKRHMPVSVFSESAVFWFIIGQGTIEDDDEDEDDNSSQAVGATPDSDKKVTVGTARSPATTKVVGAATSSDDIPVGKEYQTWLPPPLFTPSLTSRGNTLQPPPYVSLKHTTVLVYKRLESLLS